jgi:hypothetical protein
MATRLAGGAAGVCNDELVGCICRLMLGSERTHVECVPGQWGVEYGRVDLGLWRG